MSVPVTFRRLVRRIQGPEYVPDIDHAQCVVACNHPPLGRWPSPSREPSDAGDPGPDGADLALLEEMNDLRIMKRFARVTLFSGDGIFTPTMAALAAAGIETTVVSWETQLSRRLRAAAQHVVTLIDPEATIGEAS